MTKSAQVKTENKATTKTTIFCIGFNPDCPEDHESWVKQNKKQGRYQERYAFIIEIPVVHQVTPKTIKTAVVKAVEAV